jgi:hypothetical protein
VTSIKVRLDQLRSYEVRLGQIRYGKDIGGLGERSIERLNEIGCEVGLKVETNFCWCRLGSLLPGLCMFDPPLSPPTPPAEIFWRTCLDGVFKKFQAPRIFVLLKSYFFMS